MDIDITHSRTASVTTSITLQKDYSRLFADIISDEDEEFAHSAYDGLDFVEFNEDGLKSEVYQKLRELFPDFDWGGGIPYMEIERPNEHYEILNNFDREKAISSLKDLKLQVGWEIQYELSTPNLTKIETTIAEILPNQVG